jgi:hypothetical protein
VPIGAEQAHDLLPAAVRALTPETLVGSSLRSMDSFGTGHLTLLHADPLVAAYREALTVPAEGQSSDTETWMRYASSLAYGLAVGLDHPPLGIEPQRRRALPRPD